MCDNPALYGNVSYLNQVYLMHSFHLDTKTLDKFMSRVSVDIAMKTKTKTGYQKASCINIWTAGGSS